MHQPARGLSRAPRSPWEAAWFAVASGPRDALLKRRVIYSCRTAYGTWQIGPFDGGRQWRLRFCDLEGQWRAIDTFASAEEAARAVAEARTGERWWDRHAFEGGAFLLDRWERYDTG